MDKLGDGASNHVHELGAFFAVPRLRAYEAKAKPIVLVVGNDVYGKHTHPEILRGVPGFVIGRVF